MALILIVDDTPDMLGVLTVLVAECGHDVVTAADGHEALRLVVLERPALVLLDHHMPGLDGMGVLRRLFGMPRAAAEPPSPIVLMLTADDRPEVRAEAVRLGAAECLSKCKLEFDGFEGVLRRYVGPAAA